uniref:AHH domain-containing protein n=1 Tax=Stigmatella hybrida TaxID=394097 RepID=UPI001CDAA5EA|nr:AHH domain-containing protein [Stigmatella hybrida]
MDAEEARRFIALDSTGRCGGGVPALVGSGFTVSVPVDAEGHEHHIATNKWKEASHSGGPWTPKFQEVFDRAGMSLDDAANKVRVKGHQGPHPEEYHREVFKRLNNATLLCRSMRKCGESLVRELQKLAKDIVTEGSELNKLVTRTP